MQCQLQAQAAAFRCKAGQYLPARSGPASALLPSGLLGCLGGSMGALWQHMSRRSQLLQICRQIKNKIVNALGNCFSCRPYYSCWKDYCQASHLSCRPCLCCQHMPVSNRRYSGAKTCNASHVVDCANHMTGASVQLTLRMHAVCDCWLSYGICAEGTYNPDSITHAQCLSLQLCLQQQNGKSKCNSADDSAYAFCALPSDTIQMI